MDMSEYTPLSPGGYVKPADRARAVKEMRENPPQPPREPEPPKRIAGRTRAEFLVEYVLGRAIAHTGGLEGLSALSEAGAVWDKLAGSVGYDG